MKSDKYENSQRYMLYFANKIRYEFSTQNNYLKLKKQQETIKHSRGITLTSKVIWKKNKLVWQLIA